MSYRRTNYRKVKRAMKAARFLPPEPGTYPRHHGNRISHWMNARPLDKSADWGKPRAQRVA